MPEYKLEVTTGEKEGAGTLDHIYIILCGSDGQSEWTELDNFGIDFRPGKVSWNCHAGLCFFCTSQSHYQSKHLCCCNTTALPTVGQLSFLLNVFLICLYFLLVRGSSTSKTSVTWVMSMGTSLSGSQAYGMLSPRWLHYFTNLIFTNPLF